MKKLLELLADNARYTNAEIGVMLGMSEKDVENEIRRLENDGVIRGYKAIIDWDKILNDRVTALIELKVTPQRDAGFEDIAAKIMSFPEVETIYLMSGGYDFAVIVKGHTFKEVAMFVAKRLAPLDNVISTATHFVLRRYKDMGADMIDYNGDDRGTFSF
ncbi:MAG: AsnC family transcriptional regulator [Clostridiales bacterium 43-6]|nr:MAG: AsnC family transcriptional regulator [Clostridiales bacterium 43-6]